VLHRHKFDRFSTKAISSLRHRWIESIGATLSCIDWKKNFFLPNLVSLIQGIGLPLATEEAP
jgi:hypothetical protein